MDWDIIKDILLVVTPIAVAYISYLSNKKSRKEIMTELEAKLQEKDADTANELRKMAVELENQKQISSWENSILSTEEYLNSIDISRRGNVISLMDLTLKINLLLNSGTQSAEELKELKAMISKLKLPNINEELYPYEITILYDFNLMLKNLDKKIQGGETNA